MTSLQDLPTELLQRIATFLPCSATLNLIRTNHRIRATCNDHLVFKAIALDTRQHSVSWRDTETFLEQARFEDTMRTAYAVDQAFVNAEAEDTLWGLKTPTRYGENYIDEWLPHMLALRNPAALTIRPESLFHVLCRLSRVYQSNQPSRARAVDFLLSRFSLFGGLNSAAQFESDKERDRDEIAAKLTNIGFCLTALTLEHLYWYTSENATFKALHIYNRPPSAAEGDKELENGLFYTLPYLITNTTISTPSSPFPAADAAPLPFAFIYWLHVSGNLASIALPVPSRIPFSKYIHIPTPYRGSGRQFSTAHVAKMTSPDFLSGRWSGLYTDERSQNLHIDPPMTNINIVARPRGALDRPAASIAAMIDRSSTGQDACGDFTLFGEVHEDGHVEIAKLYFNSGWEWMWNGRVMPFGIMGAWGGLLAGGFGGYFWIWKDEWCGEAGSARWSRT
ncbi:hypothetical protein BDV96DRAFT_641549 [Lophiotrema nucula]|uniref:F-box domain-containing protein n=1 Tax=Lophiotrema nucula TaxID=690887 RepID=A0A6A5ZPU3_9PLEO|nr:hypothetical protein BDV96DRAFT_641549 [Lophiotrema nucula]